MGDKNAALLALVDLVVDAIKDGIAIAEDGSFSVIELAKFSNLMPELLPAFASIGMVPAEVKALTFSDDEALVLHVVAKLGVTNAKAVNIITASLKLAADAYDLIKAIKS